MSFLYQVQSDGTQVNRWELGDKPFVVGRDDYADACVEDEKLSRSHFLITREGAEFAVIDLNSSNGTQVNGRKVTAHRLRPNEVILAGESLFYLSDAPVSSLIIPGTMPWTGTVETTQPRVSAA